MNKLSDAEIIEAQRRELVAFRDTVNSIIAQAQIILDTNAELISINDRLIYELKRVPWWRRLRFMIAGPDPADMERQRVALEAVMQCAAPPPAWEPNAEQREEIRKAYRVSDGMLLIRPDDELIEHGYSEHYQGAYYQLIGPGITLWQQLNGK